MVSLFIGLMVTGAVASVYVGSARAGRQLKAMAQITEEAQLALALLRRDLQLAGSAEPTGVVASTQRFAAPAAPRVVFGCEQGFTSAVVAVGTAACAAATSGTPAIEVTFEATADNTVGAYRSANAADCLGAAITGKSFTSHRYYVDQGPSGRNELYCGSAASTSPQALAENVEAIALRYGEANGWSASDPGTHRPVRYVPASAVADWSNVVAVRVCLLMRSGFPVFTTEDVASYRDCSGTVQTATNRNLYKAFFTTVAIRNKGAV
jgi:type IV pilus assembly protein PilW